ELAHERRRFAGRHRDDRRPRAAHDRLALARPRDDPRSIGIAFDALDAHAGLHTPDSARERIGKRLHAVAKRKASLALARALDLATDETSVALLQRVQAG